MNKLSKPYEFLAAEPGPKMLIEALKLYGIIEKAGDGNNPVILDWAKECGIRDYKADSIPWCGLFMAIVAKRAGKELPLKPLWALNWSIWGKHSKTPQLGDVLVFSRPSGGHVGLYVGEDSTCFHVLGGNQSDAVNIKRVDKWRLVNARNLYKIAAPTNVRRIVIESKMDISTNEQ